MIHTNKRGEPSQAYLAGAMKMILIILATMLFSCTPVQEDKNQRQEKVEFSTIYVDSMPELTSIQQEAFDALNTLQTSTDEKNRLYSTFANVDQTFYPADTSFSTTQSEMLAFMKQFVSKYCQNLSVNMQDELAKTSVLAQEAYTVFYCNNESVKQNFKNGLPMSGTWVMPNILGRRDVIMVW